MKVSYYDEQSPKSIGPLIVVIAMSWAAIALGVIVSCGVMK